MHRKQGDIDLLFAVQHFECHGSRAKFLSYHVVIAIVLDMIFEIPSLRVISQKSDLLVSLISLNKHSFIVVFYIICYIHIFILFLNDNCTFIFHNA